MAARSAVGSMPVTLQVYRGDELVRTERFERPVIKIGRLASAHLRLEDERVARLHSVIEVAGDGALSIVDMGSAAGTIVNGRRVSRGPLRPGDQIMLGALRIVLAANAATNAATAGRAPEAQQPAAQPFETPRPAPPATPEDPPRPAPPPEPEPVEPEPVERASAREVAGVELRLYWGGTLLDSGTFARPAAPVRLGEGPRCSLQAPAELLPEPEFPVLRFDAGEHRLAFGAGMVGAHVEGGRERPLVELSQAGVATPDEGEGGGVRSLPVPTRGFVRVELGSGLFLEAWPRTPPAPAVTPFWKQLELRFANLFLVLLAAQAALVVLAVNDAQGEPPAAEASRAPQRLARWVMPAEPPRRNPYLEKLAREAERSGDPGEQAARHRGAEGQMGKKDVPRTEGRSAPRAVDLRSREQVRNLGLLAAVSGRNAQAGLSTIFGQGGLGGDIQGAIGNLFGPVVADSRGAGGLGLKGTGTGGGGAGDTIGIGAVGTRGRGGGLAGYGDGVGGLGKKGERDVGIATADARVLGAVDAELVRKVIRDHASQIRYCYEQQLAVDHRLAGKVAVRWQIGPDGRATHLAVDGADTTLESPTVHDCMMARIASWEFPKPKGGGIALIKYPWILRSSGGGA